MNYSLTIIHAHLLAGADTGGKGKSQQGQERERERDTEREIKRVYIFVLVLKSGGRVRAYSTACRVPRALLSHARAARMDDDLTDLT